MPRNQLERLLREIRRRTRVEGVAPIGEVEKSVVPYRAETTGEVNQLFA